MTPISGVDWLALLHKIGEKEADFTQDSFAKALQFVVERFAELREGKALFVSVG
ncbi:MAG: hypothetical protein RMN51_11890 [Verrucomicrobiota bacterium]|nr:hypothetical protein [Limisphaera sp.]MDW8382791.1 hypothetical protein [Verrucomicrobiota bacterium]